MTRRVTLPDVVMLPNENNINIDLANSYQAKLEIYKERYKDTFEDLDDTSNKMHSHLVKSLLSSFISYHSTMGTEEIEYLKTSIEEIEELFDLKVNRPLGDIDQEKVVRSRIVDIYFSYRYNPNLTYKEQIKEFKTLHTKMFKNTNVKAGTYKKSNNMIPHQKIFIEPKHVSKKMEVLFEKIETLSHNSKLLPAQLGVLHAYLVGIHPFQDGNGRLVRIWMDKILSNKIGIPLFISEAIVNHKTKYHNILDAYHFHNDYIVVANQFLEFSIDQLDMNIRLLKNIKIQKEKYKELLKPLVDRKYLVMISHLFTMKRIINTQLLVKKLSISRMTARSLIDKLVKAKVLKKHDALSQKNVYYWVKKI